MEVSLPLQEAIKAQIALSKKPFAIFDFDNTCITNDIGEAMLAYLCRNKLLRDFSLLGEVDTSAHYHERVFATYHDLYDQGKTKEAYMLNARMFSGFTPEEAAEATQAAIHAEGGVLGKTELYGHHIAHGLVPNHKALSLLQFVQSLGIETWIVSASAEVAVETVMKYFGIEAKLIGVRSHIGEGKFTNKLQEPMPILAAKVDCVRTYITESPPPLLAVDDSMTGINLLETATIPVVIDRNNALAKEARERGWFII